MMSKFARDQAQRMASAILELTATETSRAKVMIEIDKRFPTATYKQFLAALLIST
jgi:hypothetical protein